jgi:NO-binding membrane sensor protein with MHYT domain/nitrogen-specific signal transduction histidine kinase
VNLIGSYNYALVALSVLIAMLASYAALNLAGRVTAAGGWTRVVWLLGGAGAMGTGIWSMHYIGMLAFILPVPVAYHWPTVLLSLVAAIVASAIALHVVSRQTLGAFRALAGSVLMGTGIASMHYVGMEAMRLPAMCQYDSFLVALSVFFALLISLVALWITFHFRVEKASIGWRKIAGAVVMGAAIPVMHYTGMAAARFTPSDMPVDLSNAVSISTLGTAGIAAATLLVLVLALLTSWADRRFAARTLELQELKLQQSEAYLSEAQRLSHTGSFGWKVSTGEVLWSEETFRIFQYDLASKPTLELVLQRFHPEDAALVKQTIERASQDGKDFDFEDRLLMPDGSVKYVHVVAHALSAESSSIEFVGALMDVTERKRAEDALRSAQAELAHVTRVTTLGEMTASIAHEINQPLAAVVTNGSACLRWLMAESPNLEEAREASKRVIRDGNRASEVIARIRALMQKTETQKAELDINEAIQEIVLLTQNEAARKGVRLRLELAAKLPPVFGDRVQLQQVALNLVMNGVEAMAAVSDRPRELVICSRAHESDQVLIAVRDCGMGIAPADLEKIFNAFYTTKSQGMGMGLAISRSIIEAHGGRLWATPNEVAGATIQFTLPLSNHSE